MMRRSMGTVFLGVILMATSAGLAESVVVGGFEGDLDGWYTDNWTAGKVSQSTTGATAGAQAMQVEGPGGWQQLTKVDVRAHRLMLATKGAEITADVTAFEADMTTSFMQVGLVINAQNNDDNGANNNLGWNDLGLQDVARDGQPHTLTWTLPDAVTAKIAGADDTIAWFEILLISNADAASVTKFYIDNIQVSSSAVHTGKSTDTVIGNWELEMEGWVKGGGADVLFSDVNGVTLDAHSLDIWVPTGAWATVLSLNLLDPNQADVLAAFRVNTKITADITHMAANWPADDVPGWNGKHLVINCGGDGWSLWQDLGYQAHWTRPDGDRTIAATWDYGQYLGGINFDKLSYCSLELIVNANDSTYAGPVWFYLDNMKLSGAGVALNPLPANGALDVDINTLLNWTGGTFATSHDVYLGTTSAAVGAAKQGSDPEVTFVQVDTPRFDPNGLAFGTRYFWRVDEANEANPDGPWTGPVWSFTTANFITVDDFESYNDDLDAGEAIFNTWLDGFDDPDNGSQIGYFAAPFAEQTIIHGGRQSMPFEYSNVDAAYSETIREWSDPQDWTRNGYDTLKIHIMGKADNTADEMYITVEDEAGKTATMRQTDTAFMTAETWTEWLIPISQFAGVDMTSVMKITVGIGGQGNPSGAKGLLFIDDIQVVLEPFGLVAHYQMDGDVQDSSGNGFHGTLAGDPNFPVAYVNGPAGLGKGLLFDGAIGHQYIDLGPINPSAATGKLSVAMWAKWDGLSDAWQGLIGKRQSGWSANEMMWQLEANQTNGSLHFQREGANDLQLTTGLTVGQWTHLAVTFDGTTLTGYVDGAQVAQTTFSFGFATAAPVQIGSSSSGGGNAFNGTLDEVRIYDKALSADEVKTLAGK